jgi:hypothetical protein
MATKQERTDQFAAATLWSFGEVPGYSPTYHQRLVSELGAVGAAKRLLRKPNATGLERLAVENRLDVSAENLALQHEFSDLFSDEEIVNAVRTLAARDFTPCSVSEAIPSVN